MAGSTQTPLTPAPLTPDSIVDTAERLIVNAEADARDWSLRSLSRALGCAPGALYRHFPGGVDEIFDHVRLRESLRLQSSIIAAEDDPGAPGLANLAPFSNAARLMRRCTAYLDFAAGQGAVYRHLFSQPPGASTHPNEAVVGAMIDYPATLIQTTARSRELNRPSVGRREAMAVAQRIWFQLHGYADLRMNGVTESRDQEDEISLLISLLSMAGFTVAATPAGLE